MMLKQLDKYKIVLAKEHRIKNAELRTMFKERCEMEQHLSGFQAKATPLEVKRPHKS